MAWLHRWMLQLLNNFQRIERCLKETFHLSVMSTSSMGCVVNKIELNPAEAISSIPECLMRAYGSAIALVFTCQFVEILNNIRNVC